jgi:sucrose-6-phosphate hydrolase SacC (GH32 family)
LWHVFPVRSGLNPNFDHGCNNAWCHNISADLLRWRPQHPLPLIGGLAGSSLPGNGGSLSVTEAGVVALWGGQTIDESSQFAREIGWYGLQRQVPVGPFGADARWGAARRAGVSGRAPAGAGLRMGQFPARALRLDGDWYVPVSCGIGGSHTKLGGHGSGCIAWMKASNGTLSNFTYAGRLLEVNHTTGHIDGADGGTVTWREQDKPVAYVECPDVFPLAGKFVVLASLCTNSLLCDGNDTQCNQLRASNAYTNECACLRIFGQNVVFSAVPCMRDTTQSWSMCDFVWACRYFVGTFSKAKAFTVERRGLLDGGQLYAARSGGGAPGGRRLLFATTGWRYPAGMDLTCRPQIHHIPRDLGLDVRGRLTISPIPELASLRVPGSGIALSRQQAHADCRSASRPCLVGRGASLQLQLDCTGVPTGAAPIVGLQILATPGGNFSTHVGYDFATGRLFIDHTRASARRPSGIVQTAPLADGPGPRVLLDVLVDHAMVEAFVNRRAALSSFVTEVMADAAPPPEQRLAFMLPPPPGVSCEVRSHALSPLV